LVEFASPKSLSTDRGRLTEFKGFALLEDLYMRAAQSTVSLGKFKGPDAFKTRRPYLAASFAGKHVVRLHGTFEILVDDRHDGQGGG
jgi:hypothetical protein